jgi:hypothetical protein
VHEHVVTTFALDETVPLALLNHLTLPIIRILLACLARIAAPTRRTAPRRQFRGLDEVQKKDRNLRPHRRRRTANVNG